ncbi:MAG: hypothetical protein ACOH2H_06845 [Cypionkella sp.]
MKLEVVLHQVNAPPQRSGAGLKAARGDDQGSGLAVHLDQVTDGLCRCMPTAPFNARDDLGRHLGMGRAQDAIGLDRAIGALWFVALQPIGAQTAAKAILVGVGSGPTVLFVDVQA